MLVVFDLGGVVVRIRRTMQECFEAAGLRWAEPRRDAALRAREAALERAYWSGAIDGERWAGSLAALHGGLASAEQILTAHRLVVIDEYPGVAELIERLPRSAALSNTCALHIDPIRDWPAIRRIGRLFLSHEIGAVKPEPEAYRLVQRATGVAGEEILFFDDSAANVDAARACGWQAELINPHRPTAPQLASELRRRRLL